MVSNIGNVSGPHNFGQVPPAIQTAFNTFGDFRANLYKSISSGFQTSPFDGSSSSPANFYYEMQKWGPGLKQIESSVSSLPNNSSYKQAVADFLNGYNTLMQNLDPLNFMNPVDTQDVMCALGLATTNSDGRPAPYPISPPFSWNQGAVQELANWFTTNMSKI